MSDAAMGFLHVGMKVHDIERATRFYTAVFGIIWEPVREYQLGDIAFTVDDLDAAIATAAERGLRLVSEYRSEQVDFAFFAGDDLGGLLAQLVHFKRPRQLPDG